MDRLSPETSENSRMNEATPLLQDEPFEISPEIYALGGAVGGSETEIDGAVDGFITERDCEEDGSITGIEGAILSLITAIKGPLGTIDGAVSGSVTVIDGNTICVSIAEEETSAKVDGSTAKVDGSTAKVDGSTAKVDGSTAKVDGSTAKVDDSTAKVDDASGCVDKAITVAQADIDNIVKGLFSAWEQSLSRRDRRFGEPELFPPRTLHVMSIVWRQIKDGRDDLPEPEVIVQGLVKTFVDRYYPSYLKVLEGQDEVIKEIFTARVTEIIGDGWKQILDLIEKVDQERARRKREARRRIRERLRKSQQVAEVLRFYAPFAQLRTRAPWNCRTFCLLLCNYCSIIIYQIPIHFLLLCWPISIGVMGGLYMTQCPLSHLMPYVMMALGAVGTVALLMRLWLIIYHQFSQYGIESRWPWNVLRFIEFLFLDVLIVQLLYFFAETPSFDSGSPRYCNQTFYTFVYWINYASIGLVSAWILVYFTRALLWMLSRKVNLGFR